MSKYTTELRSICEQYAGYDSEQDSSSVNTVIEKALPKLFDFTFPIYDENYRNVLETKIVKHFYTREIGYETVGRWKLALDERLNLIMPYYNERYKSTLFEFNPMYDVDLTTDHSKGNEGKSENTNTGTSDANNDRKYNRSDKYERNLTSTNTSNDNSDRWQYYNDTPQGGITGLETGKYLTNATHNTDTSNSTNTGTDTGSDNRNIADTDVNTSHQNSSNTGTNKYTDTESYLEHVKGKTSGTSYSKLLAEYRKTFINIDEEIIDNLNDLFMNLW